MLKNKGLRFGAVAAAVASCLAFGGVQAAQADPSTGTYPPLTGAGSDTTQDIMNVMSRIIETGGTINPAGSSPYQVLGSWDATGSATIQTTTTGTAFTRPNGSGSGQRALRASILTSTESGSGATTFVGQEIDDQLDFARSSSAPSATGTTTTFIPFAQDTVTFAVNAASDFPRNIPLGNAQQALANPNALTLWNIYHCTFDSYVDNDGAQIAVKPLIPQSGSGTYTFWLQTMGLTEADLSTYTCVTSLGGTVQEHNGLKLTDPGQIVPFSISQYISQGNREAIASVVGATITDRRSFADLGSVFGARPLVFTSNGIKANPDFPIGRLVFNVVETARLSTTGVTEDSLLQATFAGSSSYICDAMTAGIAAIELLGFAPTAECGNTVDYLAGFTAGSA